MVAVIVRASRRWSGVRERPYFAGWLMQHKETSVVASVGPVAQSLTKSAKGRHYGVSGAYRSSVDYANYSEVRGSLYTTPRAGSESTWLDLWSHS